MKNIKKQLALAGLLVSSLATVVSTNAETLELKFDKGLVVSTMNSVLMGTEVNIDNYGSRTGNSWYKPNSYVRLPNGKKFEFDVKSHTVTVKGAIGGKTWRTYKAYVNDIASSSVSVKAAGKSLKMRLDFESAGDEALVRCLNFRNKTCVVEPLKKSVQVNNLTLSALLKPVAYKNSLSFAKNPQVKLDFDLKFDSKLLNAVSAIVNKFTGYKPKLKELAAVKMQKALNSYRGVVADKFRKLINDEAANVIAKIPGVGNQVQNILKSMKVTKVRTSGGNYIVEVSFPDPINAESLVIKSLKPTHKNLKTQCPNDVEFNAKIQTKYTLKGKVWLENENGSKTKKISWSNGKGKTTSSVIKRSWDAKGYKKQNGWSRMVVTYKDQKGKTYTKKSSKVKFSRTCSKGFGNIKMSSGLGPMK